MYKIALIVLNVRPLWVYKRNIIQLAKTAIFNLYARKYLANGK